MSSTFTAQKILQYCVNSWVSVALFGQWIFASYILLVFGSPVLRGNLSENSFSHIIKGYVEGDGLGNFMMLVHILPAALLSISGVLQIIPYLRKHYPKFHKYNGRFFLTVGLFGALTGLYLTWVRDTRLSDIGSIGITINGLLIPLAIYFAWKYARLRRFELHQRWAIHAFLLINGVWMFRLLIMFWYIANQGPNGNTKNLDGPADIFLSFSCYALPMIIAELIFWAKRQPKSQSYKVIFTICITFIGTIITAVGVVAASMFMWSPRIMEVFA